MWFVYVSNIHMHLSHHLRCARFLPFQPFSSSSSRMADWQISASESEPDLAFGVADQQLAVLEAKPLVPTRGHHTITVAS